MKSLVIKSWRACNAEDECGRFVAISGRREGLVSWFMTLLRLDTASLLAVYEGRIEFEESSIFGKARRLIPLSSISAISYGYTKPWLCALHIFLATAGCSVRRSGSTLTVGLVESNLASPTCFFFPKKDALTPI